MHTCRHVYIHTYVIHAYIHTYIHTLCGQCHCDALGLDSLSDTLYPTLANRSKESVISSAYKLQALGEWYRDGKSWLSACRAPVGLLPVAARRHLAQRIRWSPTSCRTATRPHVRTEEGNSYCGNFCSIISKKLLLGYFTLGTISALLELHNKYF